jgi:hypothetical protein
MIITKEVEVILTGSNIKYYEDLGYEIPRRRLSTRVSKKCLTVPKGSKIKIKIEDLPKGSHCVVECFCDYCLEEGKKTILRKPYYKYINQNEKSIIKKDCCEKCKGKKQREYFLSKYGVVQNSQLKTVREKISKANLIDEEEVNRDFEKLNYIKLSRYTGYNNPIEFICKKHKELGIQTTTYSIVKRFNSGCKKCRYESVTGENCHLWKGGITNLKLFLRGKLGRWKGECIKKHGRICILTGDKHIEFHHIYGFNKVVFQTIEELNIPIYDKVNKYSDEQLRIIEERFYKIHDKHLGIPINKDIHKIFHNEYGYGDNTLEQFKLFKTRYIDGEFDDDLSEKLKSYNSKKRF